MFFSFFFFVLIKFVVLIIIQQVVSRLISTRKSKSHLTKLGRNLPIKQNSSSFKWHRTEPGLSWLLIGPSLRPGLKTLTMTKEESVGGSKIFHKFKTPSKRSRDEWGTEDNVPILDWGEEKFSNFLPSKQKRERTSKRKTFFLSHISGRFFCDGNFFFVLSFKVFYLLSFVYDETFSFKEEVWVKDRDWDLL